MNKKFVIFIFIFTSICFSVFAEYQVNLSEKPEKRWVEIVNQFNQEDLRKYAAMIDESITKAGIEEEWLRQEIANYGWNRSLKPDFRWFLDLREEVKGLAKALKERMDGKTLKGFSESDLFLLNMGYDFSTYCTTGVYQTSKGPVLFRNLDWEGEEFKKFTFETTFYTEGKELFKSIQFLGQVGVLTGMKPQGYAFALNYRKTPGATFSEWNIVQGLFTEGWSCSLLLRYTLEHDSNFSSAKARLEKTELMAPCYITIAGIKQNEGAVIERGRDAFHTRTFSDPNENPKFLVQTNHDVPRNPDQDEVWAGDDMLLNETLGMGTIARREAAITYLKNIDNSNINTVLLMMLSAHRPVYNPLTIFSSLLIPFNNEITLLKKY